MPASRKGEIAQLEHQLAGLLQSLQQAQCANQSLKAKEKALLTQISQAGVGVHAIKYAFSKTVGSAVPPPAVVENRLLQGLQQKEQQVQQQLAYLGLTRAASEEGYGELYTTQMLRKLVADPSKQQELLSRTKEQALKHVANVAQRFGLLVNRYDAPKLPSGYSPQQELDDLIDDCVQATLFRAILEPLQAKQRRNTAFQGINMITGNVEPYPPGWFLQVAKAMCATPEQRDTVVATWSKAQADLNKLMQRLDDLANQLCKLQQAQAAEQEEFNRQAEAVGRQVVQAAHSLRKRRQQDTAGRVYGNPAVWSQQSEQFKQQSAAGSAGSATLRSSSMDSSSSTTQLLMLSLEDVSNHPGPQQQQVEAEMESIVVQMNLMSPALAMMSYNTFSRKQLALGLINAYPFVPDNFALYAAFAELDE